MIYVWRQKQSLRTSYICQVYGITLYSAARADESSSHPAGFGICLCAQTYSFLPHMCCALKQTRQEVCNVKSVFAQVCEFNNGFSVYLCIPTPPPPSPPPPLPSHHHPFHEDPTSLGQDVLPLKLHGEFCLSPPSAACNCTPPQHTLSPASDTSPVVFLFFFLHNSAEFLLSFLMGGGKGGFPIFFVFLQIPHLFCLSVFFRVRVRFTEVTFIYCVGFTISIKYPYILCLQSWLNILRLQTLKLKTACRRFIS